MLKINKIIFVAQIFIILGSLTLFYRISDNLDKQNKKIIADVSFQAVNTNVDRMITNAKFVLDAWAKDIEINEAKIKPADFCTKTNIRFIDNSPIYFNYGVGDLNGNIICTREKVIKKNFKEFVNNYDEIINDKNFKVTDFGWSSTEKVIPRIAAGLPVLDKNGRVKYVITIALDLTVFKDRIKQMLNLNKSNLMLVDQNGIVEFSIPEDHYTFGDKLNSVIPLSLLLSKKTGQLETTEDGVNVIYTYKPLTINEDKDYVHFLIHRIERKNLLLNIPDYVSVIQLYLLVTSIGLLIYTLYKSDRKKSENID